MEITDIEMHVIYPPLHAWKSEALTRFQGPQFGYRIVYIIHTDNGLEGLGETRGKPADPNVGEWSQRLIGTNPCDWLGHPTLPFWLASAIYDVVGKYNDVPAYKLFGPKVRSRVPVATWTVSQTPSKMAEEVRRAVEGGYTWLKYHTSHFHNVVAQTEAMQEVAPPGFKVHYDLNWDSTIGHIMELTRALEKYPIAGAYEDPLRPHDIEGYRLLRQKCPIPVYLQNGPSGYGRPDIIGLADGYMLSSAVGPTIRSAGLFEAFNVPFLLQHTGGDIVRAFVAHIAAAFKMATLHHITATYLWAEDVVTPTLEVAGGSVPVPEEPGLGVTLDRDALERWSDVEPDPLPRALVRVQYEGLPTVYARLPVYNLSDEFTGGVAKPNFPGNLELADTGPSFVDGYGPGYNHPVDMDYWDDDGSAAFSRAWEGTEGGRSFRAD